MRQGSRGPYRILGCDGIVVYRPKHLRESTPGGFQLVHQTETQGQSSHWSHDAHIAAVEGASQRTRWALATVTVASILAFFACWNSTSWGWNKMRLETARHARALLLAPPGERAELVAPSNQDCQRYLAAAEWIKDNAFVDPELLARVRSAVVAKRLEGRAATRLFVDFLPAPEYLSVASTPSAHLEGTERALSYEVRDHTSHRLLVEELQAYIDGVREERTRAILDIDVPFLGVHFDINDLAFFAGVSLLVLMTLLRLALSRELANLVAAVDRALSSGDAARWYEMLSTSQVVTVPKLLLRAPAVGLGTESPIHPRWRMQHAECVEAAKRHYPSEGRAKLMSLVVLVPAAVETLIVLYDLGSMRLGKVLNETAVWIHTPLGIVLASALWRIGLRCRSLFLDVSGVWDCFHDAVEDGQSSSQPPASPVPQSGAYNSSE